MAKQLATLDLQETSDSPVEFAEVERILETDIQEALRTSLRVTEASSSGAQNQTIAHQTSGQEGSKGHDLDDFRETWRENNAKKEQKGVPKPTSTSPREVRRVGDYERGNAPEDSMS